MANFFAHGATHFRLDSVKGVETSPDGSVVVTFADGTGKRLYGDDAEAFLEALHGDTVNPPPKPTYPVVFTGQLTAGSPIVTGLVADGLTTSSLKVGLSASAKPLPPVAPATVPLVVLEEGTTIASVDNPAQVTLTRAASQTVTAPISFAKVEKAKPAVPVQTSISEPYKASDPSAPWNQTKQA